MANIDIGLGKSGRRAYGFDDVAISPDLAARQPEGQWVYRADWRAHDYQSRLRAG